MAKVRLAWPGGEVIADLHDSATASQLLAVLPCRAAAQTWGEEVYFTVPPIRVQLEASAQQVVPPGTVCFWVDGGALALPYGPTPISNAGECRLVTRCNVLGTVAGDPRRLSGVRDGDPIRVEAL